jgi:hypothetical protein
MKKDALIFFLIINMPFNIVAQVNMEQEVNLAEGPLKAALIDYITSRDQGTQDIGYVEIEQIYYNVNTTGVEIKEEYIIKSQNFIPNLSSKRFPYYYGYLKDQILLFYFPGIPFQDQSVENKKRLLEKLEPFLNAEEHIVAKNDKGEIIIDDPNFREESYNIHGGMILKILANGNYIIEEKDH